MDRVGGYLGLLALEAHARDFELVEIALAGEAKAREEQERRGRLEANLGRE